MLIIDLNAPNRDLMTTQPQIVVLLTATVDPAGVSFMAVTDKNSRMAEYCAAARRWVSETGVDGLVFCENSGHEIAPIRAELAQASVPVDVCQFAGQDFDRRLGKGYGEMATVRHALAHSPLARGAGWIVKVNGRYWLRNARPLFDGLRRLESVRVSADLRRMLTFADSRVFAFAPDFFEERLEPLHPLIDDSNGVYFEHVLARAIHAEMADGGGWLPLPVDPVIIGRGGTSGKTYAAGPHRVVVRSARRRLMRWLMGR